MPIYEYDCTDCGTHFEALVFGQNKVACPACEGNNLNQSLSVFAVSSGGKAATPREAFGPCGTCGDPRGPGSCSLN